MIRLCPSGCDIRRDFSAAVAHATRSLSLMMYIFSTDDTARLLVGELAAAAKRGVHVKVVIDAFGSLFTPDDFFSELLDKGGEVRRFNGTLRSLYFFRNHQKFVVADSAIALIGGFNISEQYFGDGVDTGWVEVGVRVEDPAVIRLQGYFDRFWEATSRGSPRLRTFSEISVEGQDGGQRLQWLVGRPGFRRSPYAVRLRKDLSRAYRLSMLMAYFVPSISIRRALGRIARQGKVLLVLPFSTDVPISRFAAWHTYKRLLRDGCEIYEYLPQPLHAKLLVVDDVVYVGSANSDFRSMHVNFEMTLRIHDAEFASEAQRLVDHMISRSQRITREVYHQNSGLVQRIVQRISYLILSRFDFLISRRLVK